MKLIAESLVKSLRQEIDLKEELSHKPTRPEVASFTSRQTFDILKRLNRSEKKYLVSKSLDNQDW